MSWLLVGIAIVAAAWFATKTPGHVASGEGWQLLGFLEGGNWAGDDIVLSADGYRQMADANDISAPPVDVDFANTLILRFGVGVSTSCDTREFRGLVIEEDRVWGTWEMERNLLARTMFGNSCTSDLKGASFLVAVRRERLPPRFTVGRPDCTYCDSATVDLASPTTPEWVRSSALN